MWLSRNFGYFFLIPGVVMLFTGLWTAYGISTARQSSVRVNGTVISSRFLASKGSPGAYYPVIEFASADGRKHQFTGNEGQLAAPFEAGKQLPVVYSSDAPESAAIDTDGDQYVDSIRSSCLGIGFTLIGGIPLSLRLRKERRSEWLKSNGQAIEARISGVERRTNIEVNGRNPYRISAHWTDPATKQVYEFRSGNLWFDPTPHMPSSKTISVLVDPRNPKHYWMDISFLPKSN